MNLFLFGFFLFCFALELNFYSVLKAYGLGVHGHGDGQWWAPGRGAAGGWHKH